MIRGRHAEDTRKTPEDIFSKSGCMRCDCHGWGPRDEEGQGAATTAAQEVATTAAATAAAPPAAAAAPATAAAAPGLSLIHI